ncbi:MAG: hypothetical protein QM496_03850 [Verrucomicrobiota bacterium]
MGSFITNIQVKVSGKPVKEAAEFLVTKIKEHLSKEFDYVENGSDDDRTVIVAFDRNGGWLTVFDEHMESQDYSLVEDLAKGITKHGSVYAVPVLVHDSDVFVTGLYQKGERADFFNSNPNYFEQVTDGSHEEREVEAFKARGWETLLSPGKLINDLQSLNQETVFAEDVLSEYCSIMGFNEDLVFLNCGDLADVGDVYEINRLFFRSKKQVPYEEKLSGLPAFTWDTLTPGRVVAVGDMLQIGLSIKNTGGAGVGIMVVLAGEAMKEGLVEVKAVALGKACCKSGKKGEGQFERNEVYLEKCEDQEGVYWLAKFPDYSIPAGVGEPDLTRDFAKYYKKYMEAESRATIHVNPLGDLEKAPFAVKAGDGKINMTIIPLENPEKGQFTQSTDLKIRA